MRLLFLKKFLAYLLLSTLLLNQGFFIPVAFAHHTDTHENGHGNNDNNENNHENHEDEEEEDNNSNGNSNNGNSGNNGNETQVTPTPTPETTPTPTATPSASESSQEDEENKKKAPKIQGLSNDNTIATSKKWEWDSNDKDATFRFVISQSSTDKPTGEYTTVKTATQSSGDGTYYLHVQAKGLNGVESETETVSTVLDNTPPATPGQPTSDTNSPTNSTSQNWNWNPSSDNSQQVEYIWWTTDKLSLENSKESNTDKTNASTKLSEGVWEFSIQATDAVGNKSPSKSNQLLVDTTKPLGSILTPSNNATYTKLPLFSVFASDSMGVASVTFKYKEEKEHTYNTIAVDTQFPYETNLPSAVSVNKTYDIQAIIIDNAGNTTTLSGVSFGYFPSAPTVKNDIVTTNKNTPLSIPVLQLLANDSDSESQELSVVAVEKGQHGKVELSSSEIVFTPNNNYVGVTNFTYTVSNGIMSANGLVTVTVVPPIEVNQVIQAPKVTLKETASQIVVSPTAQEATTISIPKAVKNPTLDMKNVITTNGATKSALISNNITINSETSVGAIKVEIPQGIEIKGPSDTWTGVINAPTIIDATTVQLKSKDSSKKIQAAAVVEVGFGDVPLTFTKAVRMVLEGQAGKLAGYTRGSVFTPIATICSADSQEVGDALADGADCTISAGGDMVIWTKHFTQFIAYTETATTPTTSSNSNTNPQTTACSDSKPASAPTLVSVNPGQNSATLAWTKAQDPVSYYLIAYGTAPGLMQYATPYIHGNGTTSYTIQGLSGGTTYYFKVRAGNGCTPGDYSNELSTTSEGTIMETSGDYLTKTFDFQEKTTLIEGVKGVLTQSIKAVKQSKPSTIEQLRNLGLVGFTIMMSLPILIGTNYAVYRLRFRRKETVESFTEEIGSVGILLQNLRNSLR